MKTTIKRTIRQQGFLIITMAIMVGMAMAGTVWAEPGRFGEVIQTDGMDGSGVFAQTIGVHLQSPWPAGLSVVHPLLTADINNDGRSDLIYRHYYNNSGGYARYRTRLANGDGTFSRCIQTDGDGDDSDTFGQIFDGDYVDHPVKVVHPLLTADVNRDGKSDLIYRFYDDSYGTVFKTRLSDGYGKFGYTHITQSEDGPETIVQTIMGVDVVHPLLIADVNDDRKPDLIYRFFDELRCSTVFQTRLCVGGGFFNEKCQTVGIEGPSVFVQRLNGINVKHPLLTADVDGDGRSDLIYRYYNSGLGTQFITRLASKTVDGTFGGPIRTNGGDGSGVIALKLNGIDVVHPLLTADVDGDGDIDLIYRCYSWTYHSLIRVRLNDGHGNFNKLIQTIGGEGPETFAQNFNGIDVVHHPLIADVDGDGDPDLVYRFYDHTRGTIFRARLNNGYGKFDQMIETVGGDYSGMFLQNLNGIDVAHQLLTADVNKDGASDLIYPFFDPLLGTQFRVRKAWYKQEADSAEGNIAPDAAEGNIAPDAAPMEEGRP